LLLLASGEQGGHAAQRGDPALDQELVQFSPSKLNPPSLGTNVAPAIHGTQISSTEKSKVIAIPLVDPVWARIP